MPFAIADPILNPVNEPGPFDKLTYLISSNSIPVLLNAFFMKNISISAFFPGGSASLIMNLPSEKQLNSIFPEDESINNIFNFYISLKILKVIFSFEAYNPVRISFPVIKTNFNHFSVRIIFHKISPFY